MVRLELQNTACCIAHEMQFTVIDTQLQGQTVWSGAKCVSRASEGGYLKVRSREYVIFIKLKDPTGNRCFFDHI